MSRLTQKGFVFAGIGVLTAGLWAGSVARADEARDPGDFEERVRIVVVDDDGTRHEELHEFDSDHPRAFLGVRPGRAREGGARVEGIVEGSGAERAGLREGDVIVRVDGSDIDGPWDLTRQLLRSRPGDVIDLEIERDGSSERVSVELGEHPDRGRISVHGVGVEGMDRLREHIEDLDLELDGMELHEMMEQLHEQLGDLDLDLDFRLGDLDGRRIHWGARRPKLGVELVGVTPELREHLGAEGDEGVLVGKVLPGMPAEEAGVRVGDLIVGVGDVRIADAGTLRSELRSRSGTTIDLAVIRDGLRIHLSVYLPEEEPQDDAMFERERPARPASNVTPMSQT